MATLDVEQGDPTAAEADQSTVGELAQHLDDQHRHRKHALAPRRGFETVTSMIDGIFQHRDTNGGGGLITDGDTQWMTAAAGLSFWQPRRRL